MPSMCASIAVAVVRSHDAVLTREHARRLGGDRYIQLPWCSGGDMKAWLESRTPQRTVAEACLVLHDILRVRV